MAKDKDRVVLSKCVGKLMAYVRLDKKDDAKAWARSLLKHLVQMELISKEDLEKLK